MWYYVLNGKHQPPVDARTLVRLRRQHVITSETQVWSSGMEHWIPFSESGLADEAALPPALPGAPVEAAPVIDLQDGKETCAYSGLRALASEMVQIDGFWILISEKDAAVEYLQQGGRLPKVATGTQATGNLDPSHLMSRAWALLKGCVKPAVAMYLLVFIPMNMAGMYWISRLVANQRTGFQNTYGPGHVQGGPAPVLATMFMPILFVTLLMMIISDLGNGGILFIFSARLRGKTIGLGEAFGGAFANWGRLIVMRFVMTFFCLLGFLALIIPVLVVAVRACLAGFAVVDGQMGGKDAFFNSIHLTERRFWRTALTLVVLFVAVGLPAVFIMGVVRAFFPGDAWVVPHAVLDTVLRLPTLYLLAYLFCYYKELQATKTRAGV